MCPGEESTILLNGSNPCEGYIGIYHNGTLGYVGGINWTKENDEVVCKSINCGDFKSSSSMPTPGDIDKVWIDEVNCAGNERHLWNCPFPGWAVIPTQMNSLQRITCSHSIGVRLIDGPGKCAGRLEIQHEDTWQRVDKGLSNIDSIGFVCGQLNCGKKGKSDEKQFSQGSGKFLAYAVECENKATGISDCLKDKPRGKEKDKAKAIICDEHKMVFLAESCSGMVGIAQGDQISWLSGSNTTWNKESANTVCQLMQFEKSKMLCKDLGCGEALEPTGKPKQSPVIFSSLHSTKEMTNLSQCIFVRSNVSVETCEPAYVVCSGSYLNISKIPVKSRGN
ncbi:scavenger receptor cysteine-rich type 1 protein M130-like [Lycodopsis pacificus]